MQKGLIYGVGLTPDGRIALEIGASSANVRLGVLVDPRRRVIAHSCPVAEQGKPCWHLAAGIDALAFLTGRRLIAPQRGPAAEVDVVNEQAPAGIAVVRDLTENYYAYKGVTYLRRGDFKMFRLEEPAEPEQIAEPAPAGVPPFPLRLVRASLAAIGLIRI